MIALDTNILVYAHRSRSPLHQEALALLNQAVSASQGFGISYPVLTEFWMVATHSSTPGKPSTPELAAQFIEQLTIQTGGQIWYPGPGFSTELIHMAKKLNITGPRIFDLQIALIAAQNEATEIWTNDADFVSVPALKVSIPLIH